MSLIDCTTLNALFLANKKKCPQSFRSRAFPKIYLIFYRLPTAAAAAAVSTTAAAAVAAAAAITTATAATAA